MTFVALKQKDSEPKSLLTLDPIIPKEVDMSDLPSWYTEDIKLLRQVFNIPDPRDSMLVSSTSIWGLNKVAQQRELRPKGPSAMLPVSHTLKETLDKFEREFKVDNLPEGKFILLPLQSGTSWETYVWRKKCRSSFKTNG